MTRVNAGRRASDLRPVQHRLAVDGAVLLAGLALLLLAAAFVRGGRVPTFERDTFRFVNDHTVVPFAVVWAPMQLGNFVAVPVAAAVAFVLRRWRLTVALLLGGVGTYWLATVVKDIVPRGRPAAELVGVHIRGAAALGRGFVSGHAAVVTVLAVLAWPYLGRRARIGCSVLIGIVGFARVYVGAHLPLDVVGGVGLGIATGALVRMLLGRPYDTRNQVTLNRG